MIRNGDLEIQICGERMVLLKEKAVYWESAKTLILSDLHLGKAGHFRRHGLPIHKDAHLDDWTRLDTLLADFRPQSVLIIGDLFHSEYNREWEALSKLVSGFTSSQFSLVPGNHDILDADYYRSAGISVTAASFEMGPFSFSHDPDGCKPGDSFYICGHTHPGVRLSGRGRQSIALPAFLVGEHLMELPAFGALTGLSLRERDDRVSIYAVTPHSVVAVGRKKKSHP